MAITQPSYPTTTADLVDHVGAYTDARETAEAAARDAAIAVHTGDATAAHAASAISYAGGTGMSATDVEAAIDELATEKANAADVATDAELTAHAADETAVHGISDANLLVGYNLFNGTSFPARPDFNVVLWVGGAGADDPTADMDDGDIWFPSEA